MIATPSFARHGASVERPNPTALEGPGAATGADPAGFSSLLRQTQLAAAPAAPLPVFAAPTGAGLDRPASAPSTPQPGTDESTAAASAASDDTADGPDATPSAPPPNEPGRHTGAVARPDTERNARPAAKPRLSSVAKSPADKDAGADAKSPASADDPQGAAGATHDPQAAHLRALHDVQSGGADPASAAGSDGAEPAAEAEPAGPSRRGGAAGAARLQLRADADADVLAARSPRLDAAAEGTDAARFAALFSALPPAVFDAGMRDAATTARGGELPPGAAAAAALLAPAGSPVAEPARATSPSTLVTAALGTPDFAEELGLRVGVLVKEGVQRAELHLNPADLGPVSVQIALDGTQARIDFGADMLQTRQAIEAGLPQLASALRDAGFTLAGGGVSQHGAGRGQQDDGEGQPHAGRAGRQAGAALAPLSHAASLQVTQAARGIAIRGRLDLFA